MDLDMLFESETTNLSQVEFIEFCRSREIVIYGAGNKGKEVFDVLNNLNLNVKLFIDNNKFNSTIYDKDVISFDKFKSEFSGNQEIVVVIAIFNFTVDIEEIINNLNSINIRYVFSFVQLFRLLREYFGFNYWLADKDIILKSDEPISNVFNLLEDEDSKKCLIENIRFRLNEDYSQLSKPSGVSNEYFPVDFSFWDTSQPVNFVDCGAYNGDTIKAVLDKGININTLIAYEPDLSNFTGLENFINEDERLKESKVILFPCGLLNQVNRISFSSNNQDGSSIQSNGEDSITAVSLDKVLFNIDVTNIKMDIEGAEYEALTGAMKLIRKFKPNLAVCVYHLVDDIWKIPLLINSWNLGYKFYLRTYEFSLFGTVLYCVK